MTEVIEMKSGGLSAAERELEAKRDQLLQLTDAHLNAAGTDEAKQAMQKIRSLKDAIKLIEDRVRADRAEAAKADHQRVQEEEESKIARIIAALERFCEQRDVRYLSNPDNYLVKWGGAYRAMRPNAIIHEFPADRVPHNKQSLAFLSQVLQEQGRNYFDRQYRVQDADEGFFNLFESRLCSVIPAASYHYAFDALMHSLGDGRPENIAYLERWILGKFNQIDAKVEDATYPALVFFNDGGGAGKGLLTERLWPAMYGHEGVLPNASMDDVQGHFNAIILNRIAVHINETAMERTNSDKLKSLLGSPTITINGKYMPPFTVDNIMVLIISGNDKFSVVKLRGSKIDRRFSICRTDCVFDDVLRAMPETADISDADFKPFIKAVATQVLGNPTEVGKWLYCLRQRYPDLLHVEALHGADYDAVVNIQRSLHDRLFARVFDDADFTCIDSKALTLAYDDAHRAEGAAFSKRKRAAFVQDCTEAATKRGLSVTSAYDEHRNRVLYFHKPEVTDPEDAFNYRLYTTSDSTGRKISTVRLD